MNLRKLNTSIMRPCTCNHGVVEHYVVRPNIPSYDWTYEYSNSSNNCKCKCETYIAEMMSSITDLRNAVTTLDKVVNKGGVTEATVEQINAAVSNVLESRLSQITSRITTIETKTNNIPSNTASEITNIQSEIQQLKTQLGNVSSTTINQYVTEVNTLTDKVNTIERTLETLSADTIKQLVLDSISDSLGSDITEIVNQKLGDSFDSLLQNSSFYTTVTDHINNSTIHVTAADKAKWDAASSSSSDWNIYVDGKTLYMSK